MSSASIKNPSTSDLELKDITPPTTAEVFDEQAHEQTEPPAESQDLSGHLVHLLESIAAVEELSRQAREAAVGDLAQYESLAMSHQDYAQGLCRAAEIREQAARAL